MNIEPPRSPPPVSATGRLQRSGIGYLGMVLLWLGILLAIVVVAVLMVWSSVAPQVVPPADPATATQEPQQQQ